MRGYFHRARHARQRNMIGAPVRSIDRAISLARSLGLTEIANRLPLVFRGVWLLLARSGWFGSG